MGTKIAVGDGEDRDERGAMIRNTVAFSARCATTDCQRCGSGRVQKVLSIQKNFPPAVDWRVAPGRETFGAGCVSVGAERRGAPAASRIRRLDFQHHRTRDSDGQRAVGEGKSSWRRLQQAAHPPAEPA